MSWFPTPPVTVSVPPTDALVASVFSVILTVEENVFVEVKVCGIASPASVVVPLGRVTTTVPSEPVGGERVSAPEVAFSKTTC